jgi:hypothetical protein
MGFADAKPRDDAPDHASDLPLSVVTIADVAQPQAADFKQSRNVILQWWFKVSQRSSKSHPEVLRSFEIVNANGIAQGFDLSREHLQPLWVFAHPPLSLIERE